MRVRIPTFRVPPRVLAAIGWLFRLGRPARRDEAADFLKGAAEDAMADVVERHEREEGPQS